MLALTAWRLRTNWKQFLQTQALRVEASYRSRLRATAFAHLQQRLRRQQNLMTALLKARGRLRARQLATWFAAWHGRTALLSNVRAKMHTIYARLQNRSLGQIFGGWIQHAAVCRDLATKADKTRRGRRYRLEGTACREWRHAVQRIKTAEGMRQKSLQTKILAVLRKWWQHTASARGRHSRLSAASAHRERGILIMLLSGWQAGTAHKLQRAKRRELQVVRVASRQMRACKLRVCSRWAEYSLRRRHTRSLVQVLADRKRKSVLASLLRLLHWHVVLRARRSRAATVLKVLAAKWACRDAVLCWRQVQIDERSSGQLDSKIRGFRSTRLRHSVLQVRTHFYLSRGARS